MKTVFKTILNINYRINDFFVQHICDRVCHDGFYVSVILYVGTRNVNMVINGKLIEVFYFHGDVRLNALLR